MKYPKFLKPKGTISLVAPSFGANIDPYKTQVKSSIELFTQMGYVLDEGENIFAGKGIGISNKPELCAKELMDAYISESDCIISVGGGEMMCTILPYLDFNKIAVSPPKYFMGFSDNTNFSFVLTTGYDIASMNAQNFGSFSLQPTHACIQDALNLLTGKNFINNHYQMQGYDQWEYESYKNEENPLIGYHLDSLTQYLKYPNHFNGSLQGRLISGTLDCCINLCGTQFDYVNQFNQRYGHEGIIWIFDACDLNPFGIARGLWQLKNAGWFDHAAGFIFGKSYAAYNQNILGMDCYTAITSQLKDLNVPIIMDFEYGHFEPSMPFINGSYVTINIQDNHSVVTMELK